MFGSKGLPIFTSTVRFPEGRSTVDGHLRPAANEFGHCVKFCLTVVYCSRVINGIYVGS